jgi:thioredoxin-dependent peroxiredoxin
MLKHALAIAAVAGLAVAGLADDSKLKVKEGDTFPAVEVAAVQLDKVNKDAKAFKIADYKGKNVVIFFYPKAMTPGCTVESCGFRDALADFPKDTVVIGASADNADLQQKFINKEKLTYPLLCDTDLKLIQALGIQSPKGKTPQRVTFVVGKDGTIKKIIPQVKVQQHAKDVVDLVKSLG